MIPAHLETPVFVNQCTICLDQTTVEDQLETKCHHIFHNSCFKRWVQEKDSCPTCRRPSPLLDRDVVVQQTDAVSDEDQFNSLMARLDRALDSYMASWGIDSNESTQTSSSPNEEQSNRVRSEQVQNDALASVGREEHRIETNDLRPVVAQEQQPVVAQEQQLGDFRVDRSRYSCFNNFPYFGDFLVEKNRWDSRSYTDAEKAAAKALAFYSVLRAADSTDEMAKTCYLSLPANIQNEFKANCYKINGNSSYFAGRDHKFGFGDFIVYHQSRSNIAIRAASRTALVFASQKNQLRLLEAALNDFHAADQIAVIRTAYDPLNEDVKNAIKFKIWDLNGRSDVIAGVNRTGKYPGFGSGVGAYIVAHEPRSDLLYFAVQRLVNGT